ncbi:MAG: ribosome small subunit-dependent GTPase A [Phycisphaerae bacterium]|nr:ribosome small subunit-dependent GTPase A [Phycisphaerae bacterium]
MAKINKKNLKEKLAALTEQQRESLYKQAARKRKKAISSRSNVRTDYTRQYQKGNLEDGPNVGKRQGKGPVSLDDWVLKLLEEGKFDEKAAIADAKVQTHQGIVISIKSGTCKVNFNHKNIECILRPELMMAQRSDLTVGDKVRFSITEDNTAIVEQTLERTNVLSRPDPYDCRIERVIAANIDVAVITGSVRAPALSTNMIDRYLLAVNRGRIHPLICINKVDLLDEQGLQELDEALHPYRSLGIDIVKCSAESGCNIQELRDYLSGKIAVVVGHSGVGKSSILNAMAPELDLPTKLVRTVIAKGRHTTIKSNLYELPGDISIIDTPGVRSFGLWKMQPDELRWYFDEFDDYADSCKYNNCTHTHEPDCAVKDAVQQGGITATRYESYLIMLETINEQQ